MTAAAFYRPVGFPWSFPLTYTAGGVPFDFTGSTNVQASLYMRAVNSPLVLQPSSFTPSAGQATFAIDEGITAGIIADKYDECYPNPLLTRLIWSFTDALGESDIIGIFPIFAYDLRTIDPAIVAQDQTCRAGHVNGPRRRSGR